MLWLTSKLGTLTCRHCVSAALTQRHRIPERVHLTCLDHRLVIGCPSLTSLSLCTFTRTIQLSSLSRRQVRPKVTVHALSPCSLQGAAIQFTQPSKLLQQNLCRIAHFHMHKKTYVRSVLHMSPDKPQSVMALF